MMISFAQNFEDVYIARAFHDVREGFYIDVGAHHPDQDSVTRHFYDQGWRGINVEPGPTFNLFASRPRDVNLKVAVAGRSGQVNFYHHDDDPGTSSILPRLPPELRSRVASRHRSRVNALTLEELVDTYAADRPIHFLKLDIEGAEKEVIASTDWRRIRPELLIAEATRPYTNVRHDPWAPTLRKAGYVEVFFDGVNTYHLREESLARRHAFDRPVNALDYVERYDPFRDRLAARVEELEAAIRRAAAIGEAPRLDVRGMVRFGDNDRQAVVALGDEGAALDRSGVYLMRRDAAGDAGGAVLHLGGYEGVHLHVGDTAGAPAAAALKLTREALETTAPPRPAQDAALALGAPDARFSTAFLATAPAVIGDIPLAGVIDSALGLAFVRALKPRSLPGRAEAGESQARHEGFLPTEVADALVAAGAEDFGGVVRRDGAPIGLRYEQLIPALVAAVQELDRRTEGDARVGPRAKRAERTDPARSRAGVDPAPSTVKSPRG